jgi:hypothetical protein
MLDMARARQAFEDSTDFTVGIEEEFQILDPDTLALSQRFEELYDAGRADDVLQDRVAGSSRSPPRAGSSSAARARTRSARGRSSGSSTPSTTAGSSATSATWRAATTPGRSTCTWA